LPPAAGGGDGPAQPAPAAYALHIEGLVSGPPAQAGLRAGDVIRNIDDRPTPAIEDLWDAMREAGPSVEVFYINGRSEAREVVEVANLGGRLGVLGVPVRVK
jgi:S1-C subfamily serine protease